MAQHQQGTGSQQRTDGKRAEGKKGVSQETVASGKNSDPNNFANDRERAAAAGRKGGHSSHKDD
ncbi:KGG domain-containing protein [Plastoroseomonas hellenica]|uniref:KGG domain-containing protein n=1 Tax=Plastoroseomonas hellenica TaxID=2687306 RepID=UPI001BA48590|nr:KGG domain-containing protein [Plastoroseomonas hellenica]MBR0644177.1 stress-induced protein [Plastoroseomonas hellenica]